MRKLNVKLFLVLVIGAVAAAGSVWALHTFQYQRIAAALLWQARHAEEVGKFEQMAIYLERYLEFAPHDLEQRAHLGAALAGEHFAHSPARRRQAFYVLKKAANDQPDRLDLKRLLVNSALENREWSTARDILEALAKDPRAGDPGSPERGELEGCWGRLLVAENKPAEAIEHSRLAVRTAPHDEDSYVRLAWLLRAQQDAPTQQREKNVAEADQAVNDLVANNPASPKAHLARWRYRREFDLLDLRGAKDPKKVPLEKAAAEDVDAALVQAPEDVDALIAKADAEVMLRHPDKALDYLHQGLKLQATQGYRGASDTAEFDLLWHLGTLLLSDAKLSEDADKTAEVEQTIARLRKTRGQPAAADYLEARLLIHQKEWAKAAALLERTRPALAARQAHADLIGQIDLCLGQCYEALEEPAQAERAFRNVLQWDANQPAAHLGLGVALRMLGRLDEALDHYRKAAQGEQEPGQRWLEVAHLEILRQLQQDRRDWKKAEDAVDEAAGAIPKDAKESVEPALLRAEILMVQDQMGDAEKLLKDARAAHPDRVEFWTALADLAGRQKREDDALKILDEAEAVLHDRVELRVARALHLAADKANFDALDALVKKDHGAFGAADQETLLAGLAEAQLRAGRPDEAAGLLEELAATPARRTDLRLRLTLFDLAVRRGDRAAVDKALEEIRKAEGGEGAFYGLGQALRFISLARADRTEAAKNLDEAWRALDRAAKLRPKWAPVELARADVDELNNNPTGAINHLKEAVQLAEGDVSPEVVQRLVEALNQQGRYAEAGEYLGKLRQSLLVNTPLGRLAAGVALNAGNLDKAKELLENAGLKNTGNIRDLLLQARYHDAMNQAKEAEDEYHQATVLAPQEPAVWIAYVQFLGNHGRDREATTLIESTVKVKVPPERARLAAAQCYDVRGLWKVANSTEDAFSNYKAAVEERPNDLVVVRSTAAFYLRVGRMLDARDLLERIADRKVDKASDADVEWARRSLATVLASSTNYSDFREALTLVGLKLDDNGVLAPEPDSGREENIDLRRARARVLATQPQRQFRERAIQMLEGLQPADADDQFILALLYDADANEAREVEVLKHLAEADDRTIKPGCLTQYAQVLIRQGKTEKARLDDAEKLIERLEGLEKTRETSRGDFGTVELRVRLLEARGENDKALELIRGWVSQRAEKHSEIVLLLVAALGRQGRYADAFDLIQKEDLWHKCPPQMVGGVCAALLRSMPDANEQRNRAEGWLKEAIKDAEAKEKNEKDKNKQKASVVLKMHLADLHDLRGESRLAEGLYREILVEEPGNVVALNNLAWLLAQQTGQGAAALKCIDEAVKNIGRRAELLDTRGLVHLSLGETDAALADFTEASKDTPTAARLFHLARAQYQARDRDAALRTLRRAAADFGLQPSSVHPTEQQVCQTLLNELKVR